MSDINVALLFQAVRTLVALRGSDQAAEAFYDLPMITDEIAVDAVDGETLH